ncbi:unnamed protein product [Caenorhabditis bovis]|uniref:Uncharacterized protein n=1 Tax=Caenorhabditis bovis TaxID=2654633 RepID=A0A8S1EMB4_9PELO|nr:unnamed protein product [Caenorhabditis bovis]
MKANSESQLLLGSKEWVEWFKLNMPRYPRLKTNIYNFEEEKELIAMLEKNPTLISHKVFVVYLSLGSHEKLEFGKQLEKFREILGSDCLLKVIDACAQVPSYINVKDFLAGFKNQYNERKMIYNLHEFQTAAYEGFASHIPLPEFMKMIADMAEPCEQQSPMKSQMVSYLGVYNAYTFTTFCAPTEENTIVTVLSGRLVIYLFEMTEANQKKYEENLHIFASKQCVFRLFGSDMKRIQMCQGASALLPPNFVYGFWHPFDSIIHTTKVVIQEKYVHHIESEVVHEKKLPSPENSELNNVYVNEYNAQSSKNGDLNESNIGQNDEPIDMDINESEEISDEEAMQCSEVDESVEMDDDISTREPEAMETRRRAAKNTRIVRVRSQREFFDNSERRMKKPKSTATRGRRAVARRSNGNTRKMVPEITKEIQ